MRTPAALLLITPLLACFADSGTTTLVTTAGTTGAAGTETTDTGTGAPTSEASTSEASTSATTGTQTSDPTTSGATTGAVGNCELAPECEVGMVETGALCDSCGVQRRTCQADCTWTPMACEQDLNTCGFWVLPSGKKTWERVPVDPNSPFAPKEPVLAAVALAPQQQIYVLTATSFHALDPVTRTWNAAGGRDNVLPQLTGKTLHHATALTIDAPDTIITIVADEEVFHYKYVDADKGLVLEAVVPCCGEDWVGPNAPDPYGVRDGWGRLGDPEGWIPGDLQALCNLDAPTPIFAYNLSIGDGFVYPQDIGACFDFFPRIPYAEFTPFTYPGAPPNELIGGAIFLDGLWIFRE